MAMLLLSFLAISCFGRVVHGDPVVPCYFIFGDSLADNGNNNNLQTSAKVNYAPYGIDFASVGPSGRFTNARTMVDFIAQSLGFTDLILPHATASGNDLLRGVNYASGGSGIRPETGSNLLQWTRFHIINNNAVHAYTILCMLVRNLELFITSSNVFFLGNLQGAHISLDDQLQNHQNVIKAIVTIVGEAKATQLLNSCLYTVGMGSNDYINNYFISGSSTSQNTPEQYASLLIDQYSSQLKALHGFGARKIALFGLGQIGCAPFAIASGGKNACVQEMNAAAKLFNDKLFTLADQLNSAFTDAKFILVNIMGMSASSTNAITVVGTSCCPTGQTGLCVPNSTPCSDRSTYAFFNGFHPTEVINQGLAGRAYRASSTTDTCPTDISHLVTP